MDMCASIGLFSNISQIFQVSQNMYEGKIPTIIKISAEKPSVFHGKMLKDV